MKSIVVMMLGLFALTGCTPKSPTPDQIRRDTANATRTAAQDTKAMAQGVFDGLKPRGAVNINNASKLRLETLPGIDSAAADRIVAGRPYSNSAELVRRHIIPRAEYDRIAHKIDAH